MMTQAPKCTACCRMEFVSGLVHSEVLLASERLNRCESVVSCNNRYRSNHLGPTCCRSTCAPGDAISPGLSKDPGQAGQSAQLHDHQLWQQGGTLCDQLPCSIFCLSDRSPPCRWCIHALPNDLQASIGRYVHKQHGGRGGASGPVLASCLPTWLLHAAFDLIAVVVRLVQLEFMALHAFSCHAQAAGLLCALQLKLAATHHDHLLEMVVNCRSHGLCFCTYLDGQRTDAVQTDST